MANRLKQFVQRHVSRQGKLPHDYIYLQYGYLGHLVLSLRCFVVRVLALVGVEELCVGCI
jgi:hypothetical protein